MLGDTPAVAELQAHDAAQVHDSIDLAIDMNRVILIDPQSDQVI